MLAKPDERDTLWGVQAIADYIGRNRRQTYYYLQEGLIPGKKIGAIWIGSKSKLRAFLSDEEGKQ
jgi:hypothetical protein